MRERIQDEELLILLTHQEEQSPRNADLSLERGQVLQRLGRYDEALTAYTEILQHDPQQVQALCARRHLCFERGYLEQAEKDWETLCQLQQADEENYLEAFQLLTLRFRATSVVTPAALITQIDSILSKAIDAFPDRVTFYLEKALALAARRVIRPWEWRKEQFIVCEQVLFLCQRTAQTQEPSAMLLRGQGQALHLLSRFQEALAFFEQASRIDPEDPQTFIAWAQTLQVCGQDQQAREAIEQAISALAHRFERYPHQPLDLIQQGELLCSLQRWEEGQAVFEQVLTRDPGSARGWIGLGDTHAHVHRSAEAISAYERAIALSPLYAMVPARSHASLCYDGKLKDWLKEARVLVDCEHSLSTSPESAPLLVQKAHFLNRLERYDEAKACCEQALHLVTASSLGEQQVLMNAYLELRIALQGLKQYAEALEAYRNARGGRKRESVQDRDIDSDMQKLERFLQLQKDIGHNPTNIYKVEEFLSKLADLAGYEEAHTAYQKLCQSVGNDREWMLQLLKFSRHPTATYAAALACCEQNRDLVLSDPRLSAEYAQLLFHFYRYDEALQMCERMSQQYPDERGFSLCKHWIEIEFRERDRVLGSMFSSVVDRLRQGGNAWNTWRQRHPLQARDLRLLDLKDLDLSGADLSHVDAQHSHWQRCNLSAANLQQANFQGCSLDEGNLSHVQLQQANLREASLASVSLHGANLRGANLRGANLREANAHDFATWANHVPETFPPAQADLNLVQLSEANIVLACLDAILLNEADLSSADLRGVLMRYANVRQTNLTRARLQNACLGGADLSEARLCEADLTYADLRGACLDGADLRGANLFETRLENASLQGVDFSQTISRPPNLHRANPVLPPLYPFEQTMAAPKVSVYENPPNRFTASFRCQAPGCSNTMELALVSKLDREQRLITNIHTNYAPDLLEWTIRGEKGFEMLTSLLRRGDTALILWWSTRGVVVNYLPFYCMDCHGAYCSHHMRLVEVTKETAPFPDFWYGTCPYGHSIVINATA